MDNSRTIQDGDLVLIDSGKRRRLLRRHHAHLPGERALHARQRELYAIVLEAEKAAIATMVPGSNLLAANQAVYDVFRKIRRRRDGLRQQRPPGRAEHSRPVWSAGGRPRLSLSRPAACW
ncbi:MAG: M24 family metallopeptidase [Anaerolineae bacterium]